MTTKRNARRRYQTKKRNLLEQHVSEGKCHQFPTKLNEWKNEDKLPIVYIAKKGSKYITWKNGELKLSTIRGEAIIFVSEKSAEDFLGDVSIDDRNAKTLGRSYSIVELMTPYWM